MGSVWRAAHLTLGSDVAIKIIKTEAARDNRSLARFEQEALIAARIKSEHVVRILDHGHHEGLPFIVMDHLEGETLRERLEQRGRLSLPETATMVYQVCRALTAAHEMGLVHRDIKPENIFISPGEEGEERFRVLDFGLAKASDTIGMSGLDPTQTGTLLGTPYYLSPEQAKGLKTVGPPADLWSLGVVVFECLTGERPFSAPALAPLMAKITAGEIPVPSKRAAGISESIDDWFKTVMNRKPDDRFGSAKAMSRAFHLAAGLNESLSVQQAPSSSFMGAASSDEVTHRGKTIPLGDDGELPTGAHRPAHPGNGAATALAQAYHVNPIGVTGDGATALASAYVPMSEGGTAIAQPYAPPIYINQPLLESGVVAPPARGETMPMMHDLRGVDPDMAQLPPELLAEQLQQQKHGYPYPPAPQPMAVGEPQAAAYGSPPSQGYPPVPQPMGDPMMGQQGQQWGGGGYASPAQQAWPEAPVQIPMKRSGGLGLVIGLIVLMLGGGAAVGAYFLFLRDKPSAETTADSSSTSKRKKKKDEAPAASSPAPAPAPAPEPSAPPEPSQTGPQPGEPQPAEPADPAPAKKGEPVPVDPGPAPAPAPSAVPEPLPQKRPPSHRRTL
jgi:eukaryotic-like serine/threonine-protein kinase